VDKRSFYSCFHLSLPFWESALFSPKIGQNQLSIFSSSSTLPKIALDVRTRQIKSALSTGVLRFSKFGELDAPSHITLPGRRTRSSRFIWPPILDGSPLSTFAVQLCIFIHRTACSGPPGKAATMHNDTLSKRQLLPSALDF